MECLGVPGEAYGEGGVSEGEGVE